MLFRSADGTTNTLMFTEKCGSMVTASARYNSMPPTIPKPTGVAMLPLVSAGTTGAVTAVIGLLDGAAAADFQSLVMINSNVAAVLCSLGLPSGRHPSGVMAAFCDGHTQFVNDSVASWVFAQLLSSDSKFDAGRPQGQRYFTNSARVSSALETFANGSGAYKLSEGDY